MRGLAKIPIGWLGLFLLSAAAQTNAPSADRMTFADGLYARGFYDLAVKEYLLILRDEPPGVALDTVLFRAGECHRHLGRKETAERYYKRVFTDYPTSPHRFLAEFRRAELYVTAGQYLDGVNLLRALLEAGPPDAIAASAHYFLGYSLDKLRQVDEAEQHLKTVIEKHSKSPFFAYACLTLADLQQRAGRPASEVRELYRKAAEQPSSPRTGAEALFQWAEHAFRAGDFEESATAYQKLLDQYPEDSRVAEARLQIAWAFLQSGNHVAVLKMAEEQLAAGSPRGQEDWFYLKANALRQLKKPDLAWAAYEELLGRFPNGVRRAASLYEMALIAFRRGRYEKVIEQLADLTTDPAAEEDRRWLLAESYAALNRSGEALEQFRALAEKFPDSDRAAQALYRQAELEQAAGRLAAAAAIGRSLAEKYANHARTPDALFVAGVCHARLGRPEEAVRDWSALLAKHPDDPRADAALYQRAMARIQMGQEDKARRDLEQVLNNFPKTAYATEAWMALAALQEQAGRLDKAEQALREALDRKPADADLPRLRYRLAGVLQKQGREDEAGELLQALLKTDLRHDMAPALLEWLVELQLRRGAPGEALRAAQVLVERADSPEWKQIGWYWVGRGREAAGEKAGAMEAYAHALEEKAGTLEAAEAALRLGDLRLAVGQVALAETAYTVAAERASEPDAMPIRARSYFGLGRAAAARAQWEDAARYYLSVAVLFDDPELAPQSLHEAADAFGELGRDRDREKALAELKSRFPESRWTRDVALENESNGNP